MIISQSKVKFFMDSVVEFFQNNSQKPIFGKPNLWKDDAIIGCDALAASTFGEDVKPENKFDITADFCAGVDLGWNKEPHQVCTRGANEEFNQGVSVGKLLRQQLSPVLWINLSN